jgi:predicted O-methyltransferase YrrM
MDAASAGRGGAWWRAAVKACVPEPILSFYRQRRRAAAIERLVEIHGRGARPTLAERRLDDLVPAGEAAEVRMPMAAIDAADDWTMPLAELATLAAICARARPRRIFEIGTYTGLSTLVMAMNAPADAEIHTLDLAPAARQDYARRLGLGDFPEYPVGAHFAAHPAGRRIHQLFGDARELDPAPFRAGLDLVLIDANHTYDFVRVDSEHALAMLRPGGLIVWDDYVWTERAPECAGVTRYVNELAVTRPVRRIAGTRLALLVDDRPPPP